MRGLPRLERLEAFARYRGAYAVHAEPYEQTPKASGSRRCGEYHFRPGKAATLPRSPALPIPERSQRR